MLLAVVGLGLLTLVAVTAMKAARGRIQYETWYGLHLYAYLGIALAFVHELTMGTDFLDDPVAIGYWVGLYVAVFGLLLIHRVAAPIALTAAHPPARRGRRPGGGTASSPSIVTGRNLDRIGTRAGQFFQVRFLTGGGWWRPHPFSISAAPDGQRPPLHDQGPGRRHPSDARRCAPGTRVMLEGPYGAFTADVVKGDRAVLLAGGIGITPLRAILDELPRDVRTTLLVRARAWEDVAFQGELAAIAHDARHRHPLPRGQARQRADARRPPRAHLVGAPGPRHHLRGCARVRVCAVHGARPVQPARDRRAGLPDPR